MVYLQLPGGKIIQRHGPLSIKWPATIRLCRNGSKKREYECVVCGDAHSESAEYPITRHARAWFQEHDHGVQVIGKVEPLL